MEIFPNFTSTPSRKRISLNSKKVYFQALEIFFLKKCSNFDFGARWGKKPNITNKEALTLFFRYTIKYKHLENIHLSIYLHQEMESKAPSQHLGTGLGPNRLHLEGKETCFLRPS